MTLDGISVQEAIDLAKKVVAEIEASDEPPLPCKLPLLFAHTQYSNQTDTPHQGSNDNGIKAAAHSPFLWRQSLTNLWMLSYGFCRNYLAQVKEVF